MRCDGDEMITIARLKSMESEFGYHVPAMCQHGGCLNIKALLT